MAETNNPSATEPVVSQEPVSEGLEEAAEVAVEGTGTEAVQPEKDTATEATKKVEKEQAKGVDLNKAIAKLTPAEQKAYKAFQADYTKKSQYLSEYEAWHKTVVNDPDYIAMTKAKEEKAKAEIAKQPDFSKMSDEEIFNYTVDKRVEEKLSKLEEKMEGKYGSYINSSLVKQGNKLIEDFATDRKIEVDDVRELAKYAVQHKVTLDEAYKVAYFDKIPEAAKQAALDDLDLKKKANLELGSIPTGIAPVMPEKPTIRQAIEMASKQTGIKI